MIGSVVGTGNNPNHQLQPNNLQNNPFHQQFIGNYQQQASQNAPALESITYSNFDQQENEFTIDPVASDNNNIDDNSQSLFSHIALPNQREPSPSQELKMIKADSLQSQEEEEIKEQNQVKTQTTVIEEQPKPSSEEVINRMNNKSKQLDFKNSIFKRVISTRNQTQQNSQQMHEEIKKPEGQGIQSIEINIMRVMLDDIEETKEASQQSFKRQDKNILSRMTSLILETFQACNPRFEYAPHCMNPRRELTHPSDGVQNNGYDNVESDYILRVSDSIVTPEAKEYEIIDLMGKGTFGQVVKCECRQTKELVAIKVIKNKKAFKNQGVVEIKILDILNRLYDPNGESPLVRMLDFFVFRDHLCIVFELLSASVFDLLKENNYCGLTLNISRIIISQILDAMKIVKEARLIHCDLKPENILFKQKDNVSLKVIDVGSACFEGFEIFHYIQSRYYRSPEVLLGLPYDPAIDMWSLGCISAELFLGIPIFPGNSEYDQLAKIFEILGLPPQHLIHKCRYRDKYFIFQPELGTYRFKNLYEYQLTTGIQIEPPRKYINIACLDDLKMLFIEKKKQADILKAQRDGKELPLGHRPYISEAEMKNMEAFLDFLKGLLRLDKDTRWTPLMAKEHPFITRENFSGPFEPQREQEHVSTNETGDDTMSERSSSSKDSREYKVGSCPSKILYPQANTFQQPQYLQSQNSGLFSQQTLGGEKVFHGSSAQSQSTRPPILSIPEEYFKGFMFGRLDQILSMTREELYQFIYEQNQIAFKQNQQKVLIQQQMMMQQQQLQHQQQMMMQQQQQQQNMTGFNPNQQHHYQQHMPGGIGGAQPFQNHNQYFQAHQPPIPGYLLNQQIFGQQQPPIQQQPWRGEQNPLSAKSGQQLPLSQQQQTVNPLSTTQSNPWASSQQQINPFPQPQLMGGINLNNLPPMSQDQFQQLQRALLQQQQQMMLMSGQVGLPPNPGMNFSQQQMPMMQQQQQPPQQNQQFFMPQENQIYNPPPYMQQKSQLFLNAQQINDPQYQNILLQQQQKRNMNQRNSKGSGGSGGNKGKAGSWQPPAGFSNHKYNQIYNQMNNPGQILKNSNLQQEQTPQFLPQHMQQQSHSRNKGQAIGSQSDGQQAFTKHDFKKTKEYKNRTRNQNERISNTVIEEDENFEQNEQSTSQKGIPFPSGQIFSSFDSTSVKFSNQTSLQNTHSNFQETFQLVGQGPINPIQNQFMPVRNQSFQEQVNQYQIQQPQGNNQQRQGQKPFPSPRNYQQNQQLLQQQNQQQNYFHQQKKSIGANKSFSSQQSNTQNQQQLDNSMNTSMSSSHSQSGTYLKRFEQANPKQGGQIPSDKAIFNQAHHYQYSKHQYGINPAQQTQYARGRSNSDLSNNNEENKEDQSFTSNEGGGGQGPGGTYDMFGMQNPINVDNQSQRNAFNCGNNGSNAGNDIWSSQDQMNKEKSPITQKKSSNSIGFEGIKDQIKQQQMQQQQQTTSQFQSQNSFKDMASSSQPNFDAPTSDSMKKTSAVLSQFTPSSFKKSSGQQQFSNVQVSSSSGNQSNSASRRITGSNPQTYVAQMPSSQNISDAQINQLDESLAQQQLQQSSIQILGQQRNQIYQPRTGGPQSSVSAVSDRNLTPIQENWIQGFNRSNSSSSQHLDNDYDDASNSSRDSLK